MRKDDPYADMLYLPHQVSKKHPRMERGARAAQFAPFAALPGFHEAIGETAKRRVSHGDRFLDS